MICFDLSTLDFAKDPRQSSLMKALVGITALPIDFLKLEQCDLCQRRSVYYTGFQCIKSVYQLLRSLLVSINIKPLRKKNMFENVTVT